MERNTNNRAVLAALLALALALLLAGCGAGSASVPDGQDDAREARAAPISGTFVGEVPEVDAFVAVVAEPDGEGGREVRAYLCDGLSKRLNEWFDEGSSGGKHFELASEGGARMEGELTSEGATGEIALKGGESFPFEAAPATGIAGLYEVTVTPDGHYRGLSERGGRLEGELTDEPEEGRYLAVETVTKPDGETQQFEAVVESARPIDEPIDFREIVLADGRSKGAKKGGGFGFSVQDINL